MIRRWCVLSLTLAVLPLYAQTAPTAPTAPGQAAGGQPEEKIDLKFADTPVADAVAQVAAQIGVVAVVDAEITGKVTITRTVDKSDALLAVAGAAGGRPQRAPIFCSADEAKGGQEFKRVTTAKLALTQDTALADVAKQLEAATKVRVRCTSAVAALKVNLTVEEQALPAVLDAVAAKAGCKWVMGYVIAKIDPKQVLGALQSFDALPKDQQAQMFNDGFNNAINTFKQMSPADKQDTVNRIVAGIGRFAQTLQQMDPATRAQFSAAVQPLLNQFVPRFTQLDPGTQAALMPVVRALQQLK
jgi:hypothetical protein